MAAFKWLEEQGLLYGDLLPRKLLEQGLNFNGQRITLVGPQGIVDIVEVIRYLCDTHGITFNELLRAADEKKSERGGFDRKIILCSVIGE